jgi:PspAB-like protein
VGLWDTITGRTRPKRANLDALFLVPSAAITLQTAAGLAPTGAGSVCYRAATGAGFHSTQQEIVDLLSGAADAPQVQTSTDEFGFTWLQVQRAPEDPEQVAGLCTDLHAVNTTLEAEGFGPGLLCSLIPFADESGRRVGLVYLYKKGTFYPFAPSGPQRRDNLLELQVRDVLEAELPIEPELSGWLALWGAPGL